MGSRAAALGGSWPAKVAFQQSRVCHLLLAPIRPILGQSGYRTGMGMYGQLRWAVAVQRRQYFSHRKRAIFYMHQLDPYLASPDTGQKRHGWVTSEQR